MRSLIIVIVVCSLAFSALSCSVGCAQEAPLSKAKLRARVEAEVAEFTRKIPVDPRLHEQLGGVVAAVLHLSGRVAVGAAAVALPVDWLVHSEIVWPLTDAGLIPSCVPGVKPVPSSSDSVVVVLRYGINDNPKNEVPSGRDDLLRSLDAMKLSGPIFARKEAGAEPRVLYVRDFSSQSKDTTATVVIRCKVREQQTNRIRELVASEEWRFQPADNKQQRCWKQIDTQHHLCPSDEKREQSTPGKAGG